MIPLLGPLGTHLDRTAADLMGSAPGLTFDFTSPAGAPALIDVDSVSWRVFKNPVTLFIGGVAAVLLELAEPRVRDGVWDHSSFRIDPLTRLRRTGLAAMITVYGARDKAEAMIAAVNRAHARVNGTTREGMAYRASDPELLNWVQATASFGFLYAYHFYAAPLTQIQRDAVLTEAQPGARLYGATGAPQCEASLRALFAQMDPHLVPSPIIHEFLGIMTQLRALPGPSLWVQKRLIKSAVGLLPDVLISRLELNDWRPSKSDMRMAKWLATAVDRIALPSSPAAQSSVRMGRPANWAYRRS